METLECLDKLLNGDSDLEIGVQYKKELRLIEDSITESTLDIWCKKNIIFPKQVQNEIYKCFILEFDMAFSAFIHPEIDLFHYTLKNIYFCDRIIKINDNEINDIFENCIKVNKSNFPEFIKKVQFENGEWILRDVVEE